MIILIPLIFGLTCIAIDTSMENIDLQEKMEISKCWDKAKTPKQTKDCYDTNRQN
jgi:hypothetical protein